MSAPTRVCLILLTAAGITALMLLVRDRSQLPIETGEFAPMRSSGASRFTSAEDCRACHPVIYSEWESSPHATSTRDPVYHMFVAVGAGTEPDNPECQRCHHPAPIFQTPLGRYPKSRAPDRDPGMGVTCLTCHVMGDQVAATGTSSSAPCQPVRVDALRSAAMCGGCHQNQQVRFQRKHEWEEWRERSVLTQDKTCVDCHMDAIERPIAKDGETRVGHGHSFAASRDPEFMRRAFDVDLQVVDRRVTLVLRNKGTGHKLPTGYRIRNLHLDVWVEPEDENAQRPWEDTYSLHREPRWGGTNTQLGDGEVRIHAFDPLPTAITEGRIKLEASYQYAPLQPATKLFEKEVTFPHPARPLPDAFVPPKIAAVPSQEPTRDAPQEGVAFVISLVVGSSLLLWLLGWFVARRSRSRRVYRAG